MEDVLFSNKDLKQPLPQGKQCRVEVLKWISSLAAAKSTRLHVLLSLSGSAKRKPQSGSVISHSTFALFVLPF